MQEIQFDELVPLYQPTPGNCTMTPKVLTSYKRALDGTLLAIGTARIVRTWRVVAPCGDIMPLLLNKGVTPISFTDRDGERANVYITGISEISQPTALIGEYEITLEEVESRWQSS
ncbi:hypothetical protein L2W58_08035 [Dethiosulfovibrio sp. F2B]|uniref:hypothetical protein n=1 Tax=Dethiosulfovibrio faecalis TaxID=2720018 RepID=UPI001F3F903F|nr:hypothetical protein [Dethiosulfovibrio faecalis]MCF4151750.1 hypothetical protein [Dethiosulfovibrio faecalis]